MRNIDEEIKNYFEAEEIPQMDEAARQKFKNAVLQNKGKRKGIIIKKLSLIMSCAVCLLLCVIIPCIIFGGRGNNPQDTPPLRYYTDDEVVKRNLTNEELSEFINNGYNKYEFLITECNVISAFGMYIPDTNVMLSVNLEGFNAESGTVFKISFVLSEQLKFDEHDSYIRDANLEEKNGLVIYTKTEPGIRVDNFIGYIKYPNYRIYINFDQIDNDLFNKFL